VSSLRSAKARRAKPMLAAPARERHECRYPGLGSKVSPPDASCELKKGELMAEERILVVDDEEAVRQVFQDYFTILGYQVVTAESGRDALKKFVPGGFDCVLCDLVMPEMNGMDFLKELRTLDEKVAFFMMTGYPSVETALDAIKAGAYDYITKPVNLEDVRFKVERAMRMKGVEKSLKTVNGLLWAVIISIPVWLALGIILGIVWRRI
jgi:CheY-like chemotaxis protein